MTFSRKDAKHPNCEGITCLVKRSSMTYTFEEKQEFEEFMRTRGNKIKEIRKEGQKNKQTEEKKGKDNKEKEKECKGKENKGKNEERKKEDTAGKMEDTTVRKVTKPLKPYNRKRKVEDNKGEQAGVVVKKPMVERVIKDLELSSVSSESSDLSKKVNSVKAPAEYCISVYSEYMVESVENDVTYKPTPKITETETTKPTMAEKEGKKNKMAQKEVVKPKMVQKQEMQAKMVEKEGKLTEVSKSKLVMDPSKVKVDALAERQRKRIIINVGGSKFETSSVTLSQDPSSLLARMVNRDSGMRPYDVRYVYTYFVDKDSKHFSKILNYIRCGSGAHSSFQKVLPSDHVELNELLMEATYYELDGLEQLILARL
ncbi:uncharacterized protein LOC117336591 [Pecten maximus]|uniref:uncharacterized protein LOC117336591 n=1 Tax=Pecten maximus TaxID=6579 RepID=UPI0014587CB7|nr:uncharacterized protein LOC117336591 [Pecten maximus]